MRRVIVPVLMISLLLGGCGDEAKHEEKIGELRTELAQAAEISFTADITADLGGSDFACRLQCTATGDETEIEVVEPENIAGITARLKAGEASLSYEGVELYIGALKGNLSPVSAVPVLLDALKNGYLTQCWREGGEEQTLLAAQVYVDENTSALLYFDEENMQLLHGELVIDGKTVVQCGISGLTIS